MKKMLLILLVALFIISSTTFAALSDETIPSESSSTPIETGPPVITPPAPPCADYCIEVSDCQCGDTTIPAGTEKYCSPDHAVYSTEAECESGPAPPEGYGEVLPCRNDCSAVFDCWCGENRVGPIYAEYCSPDNAVYSSEAGCNLGKECAADSLKGEGAEEEPSGAITEAITGLKSPLELVSNWQGLSALAIMLSVILVAIGYAIGIGFDMPEMKAWASTELTQVFSNVLIIIFLLAIATFLDIFVMEVVNGSEVGNLECVLGENCLNKTAQAYLGDYIDIGKSEAKNVLESSVSAAGWMNRRVGIYGKTLIVPPLLMFSLQLPLAPWYSMDFDRLGMVFNYYQGILSSLEAQSFFISEISFKVAPMILAIGIVARSFFVTRKLGGLLIAIAVSVMVFFPMMYVFDWMSLDLVATGDMPTDLGLGDCPPECAGSAPMAYYGDTKITKLNELYCLFYDEQSDQARNLSLGKIASLNSPTPAGTVYSCDYNNNCNRTCRELPYPYGIPECANYSMQVECAKIPVQCKVIRTLDAPDPAASAQCPDACKIVPPLKSNCDQDDCLKSRFDCRVAKMSDLDWRPKMDDKMSGKKKCDLAKDCIANNTDAYSSCTYVLPDFGTCDALCEGCPNYCRLDITTGLPPDCYKDDGTTLIDACTKCTDGCKAIVSSLTTDCGSCPAAYRIIGDNLKPEYTNGPCDVAACPYNETYRVVLPYSTCEKCIFAEEPYEYNPPIRNNCAELCKPSTNAPSKSSGDYTKIGDDGLVGRSEIRKVSMLMIPAYLLPLINIAATLILIRSLSGILGGDIEIPGLAKIF